MILVALAAVTYGCYLVTPALGWLVGGFFVLVHCIGKRKIAEEQKRQQRVDATMERITEEILRAHSKPEHRRDVQ